ncbi:MAG: M23 family metallopeptidase [Treponemataceae bacterium]
MAVISSYRLTERRVLRFFGRVSLFLFRLSVRGFFFVGSCARRRFSLVFVSHDDRPVHQVSFSVASAALALTIFLSLIIIVPVFGVHSSEKRASLTALASELRDVQDRRDSLRHEIGALSNSSRNFESVAGRVVSSLPSDPDHRTDREGTALFSLLGTKPALNGEHSEFASVAALRQSLEKTTVSIAESGAALKNMKESLTGVPILWPLQSGAGHVSMPFGTNPNPFSGDLYLHRGVDISTYGSGNPIIATADGVVLSASFDPISGYGNNVIIKHHYGYITRYGHLKRFRVRSGQLIKQGEIIGYVGNTGRSTGPHVHYEMQLGPRLLDPIQMIVSASHG